jgi:localization factor PodJL
LSSAKRLKGQLSAEAQTAAERAAQSFQAQSTGPQQAQAGRPNGDVVNAQRALSHLGYYRGPSDGSPSPALKFAIAAFQRDKSLPVTGNLDPSVMPMLAAAAR